MLTFYLRILVFVCGLFAISCGPNVLSGDWVPEDDAGPVVTDDGGGDTESTCGDEVCDNGLDDNCNGKIDETCGCEPTQEAACYTGPASTRNQGICKDGTMVCANLDEFTRWGDCAGDITPGVEVCDVEGLDEDCDGEVNEGCACAPGEQVACGSDVGACIAGAQTCVGDALGSCIGAEAASAETCDGIDNDCNGTVDEGLVLSCGTDVGECSKGTSECVDGVFQLCAGGVEAVDEICNNLDDDCDGEVDEDTELICGSDTGLCQTGIAYCTGGTYGVCEGSVQSASEICDGEDNNCDGASDEQLSQACGSETGVCQAGTETCNGGAWTGCTATGPDTAGPSESPGFCNGADSDCDGVADDGCTCSDGDQIQCGVTDMGPCSYGLSTCAGGQWGACVGNLDPADDEVCVNSVDDDCNGMIDDGCAGTDAPVVTCGMDINTQPLATVILSATGSDPDGGAVTYLWSVTSAPVGSTSQPANPTSANTTFFVDLAGTYELTVTVTDDEGDTATCTITIVAIPVDDIHVELIWDTAYGDADIHMLRPGLDPSKDWYTIGPANFEYDCFFGNKQAKWPPNGPGGDGTLDIDDTDGYGPENINVNTPASGTYSIGVAYFCSSSVGTAPIAPGDGPTNATVRIYCGGNLSAEYTGINLDQTGRFIHVADLVWPGCSGVSVGGNYWTSEIQPTAYTQPLHCSVACTGNSDCTPGEVCSSAGQCILN